MRKGPKTVRSPGDRRQKIETVPKFVLLLQNFYVSQILSQETGVSRFKLYQSSNSFLV